MGLIGQLGIDPGYKFALFLRQFQTAPVRLKRGLSRLGFGLRPLISELHEVGLNVGQPLLGAALILVGQLVGAVQLLAERRRGGLHGLFPGVILLLDECQFSDRVVLQLGGAFGFQSGHGVIVALRRVELVLLGLVPGVTLAVEGGYLVVDTGNGYLGLPLCGLGLVVEVVDVALGGVA